MQETTSSINDRERPAETRQAWMQRERLRELFEQAPSVDALPIVTALLAALSLRSSSPPAALALWVAGVALTTAGSRRLRRRWQKTPLRHSTRGWNLRHAAWVHLAGWLWAGLGSVPVASSTQEFLIAFVLAGMAAIALTLYNSTTLPFLAFAAPPLAALAIRFGRSGETGSQTLSVLAVAYLLVLAAVGAAIRRRTTESLSLRWRNEQLLREYTEANESLLDKTRNQATIHRKLVQRDDILQAVRFAAERLLNSRSWDSDPAHILERLGRAAGVDHVHLVHLVDDETSDHDPRPDRAYRWWGPSATPTSKALPPLAAASVEPWRSRLDNRLPIYGSAGELEEEVQDLLLEHGIRSIAVLPLHVGDSFWGCLTFEDHVSPREWSRPVVEALASAADMLAAAIQGIRVEEALKTSDDRFRLLAENTSDLVCLHRPDGSLVYVSPSSSSLLAYTPQQLQSIGLLSIVFPEDHARFESKLSALRNNRNTVSTSLRVRNRKGEWLWVETKMQPILTPDRQLSHFVTSSRDITTRKLAEEQLFREKELAQVTLRSIGDGVITTDAGGRVRYMNPVAGKLAGCRVHEARGSRLDRILASRGAGARVISRLADQAFSKREVTRVSDPLLLEDREGDELAVEVSASPMLDHQGLTLGTVTVLRDVSSTRALTQQLSYQASHDSLTGLINRREFENRLTQAVNDRRSTSDALAYLDLDQFKVVNDTCGHAAGDELLRQLAGVISTQVRSTDVVARLGGDEFGVLLTNCPIHRARKVTDGICEAIRSYRFTWGSKMFQLGVSIGVVPVVAESSDANELLSAADAACYVAKDQGRNRVHVFKPDDDYLAHRKGEMEWVSQIHSALEEDRFELHYQPIVETTAPFALPRRIEILVRMLTKSGKLVPPGSFIPAAERFNSMAAIDRWVIKSAIASFADHWHTPDPRINECFINLSGTSLADPSFGDFVIQQLNQHQVPPGILCFEITETAAITNLKEARRLILELKTLGCRFALDDFGSGLSSFSYLRDLPVDFLKIDGHFVKDIDEDSIGYSIVESINRVGQTLGLKTIAEFVETQSVRDRLLTLGVDYLQGFALARPLPVMDLVQSLEVTTARSALSLPS